MKRRNELVRSSIKQAVCIVILVLFVFLSIASGNQTQNTDAYILTGINEGWIDENGQAVDLYNLATGNHTVTLDISKLSTEGMSICFKSIDTNFKVYASNELIYDHNPEIPRHLGISYGMQYHTIAIPGGSSFINLYIEPVFPDAPAAIRDIAIMEAGQYMTDVFKRNLFSFGQGLITIVIGILFIIAGVTGQIVMKSTGIDFISFGITCAMVGFIGFNDTLLLQVLTGRPDLIRVTEYICLAFIPLPVLSFFSSTTGELHSKLLSGMFAVCLLNFFLQTGLTLSRLSDYYYLVYISQFIILICFLIVVVIVFKAIRQGLIRQTLLRSVVFASEVSEAFAKVIDMKDKYTNGHSERVAKYTAMIAKEMGYDNETVEKYYRIGLLHDVGKVGVPKAVLNKPGKLTDEEYDIIKSHTLKGYEVLKDISIVPELAVGALAHHERHDGKGYPNGLSGDEIPQMHLPPS